MSLKRVLLLSLCILVLSGLVGCREKEITDNEQITTYSGDIVLYSGDKIVVFYGSNSWAYGTHFFVDPKHNLELVLGVNRSNIGGAGSYVSLTLEKVVKEIFYPKD